MLALVGQPSLHGYYACMVYWNKGALWRNCRLKESKTSFSPVFVFLYSRYSLKRWWGRVLWLLWIGRARHPGPFSGSMTVEVFMSEVGLLMGIWCWRPMLISLLLLSIGWFLLELGENGLGFELGVLLLSGLLLLRSPPMLVMVVLGLLV